MAESELFVSVVMLCRDKADTLRDSVGAVIGTLRDHFSDYEVLIVDDKSSDETEAIANEILDSESYVRYLRLTRHCGPEVALIAGLESVIGDFVVTMEPGADDASHIVDLVARARAGDDVVVGVSDTSAGRSPVYKFLHFGFYKIVRAVVEQEITPGTTTLSVLSRRAVNAVTRARRRNRLLTIVAAETGYTPTFYRYEQIDPAARTRRALLPSIAVGISIICNNSLAPLKIVGLIGVGGSVTCIAIAFLATLIQTARGAFATSATFAAVHVSLLFSVAFLMLAIIGEYMARVLDEATERPLYHVQLERASAVRLAHATRLNVRQAAVAKDDDEDMKEIAPSVPAEGSLR